MNLKRHQIVGIGFVVMGAALQIAAMLSSEGGYLNGAAAGSFVFGIIIEIIGYAFDDENTKP